MTAVTAAAPLVARTVRIESPGALLALLPLDEAHVWVRRAEGLVGWGEVARIHADGPERFARAEAAWHDLAGHAAVRDDVQLPGTGPVAFGSFAFAESSSAGGVLIVPEVVVG